MRSELSRYRIERCAFVSAEISFWDRVTQFCKLLNGKDRDSLECVYPSAGLTNQIVPEIKVVLFSWMSQVWSGFMGTLCAGRHKRRATL